MGTILQFEPRQSEQDATEAQAGPAEVIIFPGVRIEHLADEAPDLLEPMTRLSEAKRSAAIKSSE